MKTCKKCFRKFDEEDVLDISPAIEVGDVFLQDVSIEDINDLCPEYMEELGVMNLLGFGQ